MKMRSAIVLGIVLIVVAAAWLWRSGRIESAATQPAASAQAAADARQSGKSSTMSESDDGTAAPVAAVPRIGREQADVMACHRDTRMRLELIRARVDPDNSAGQAFLHHALSRVLDPAADQHAVLERLSARWPDSSELAWAYAQACREPSCDRAVALQRLARTDPHNVATWAAVLTDAKRRKDMAAYVQALHQAAQGHAYDSRNTLPFQALRERLGEEKPPFSCATLLQDDVPDASASLLDWVDMLSLVPEAPAPSASAWSWCGSEPSIRRSVEQSRDCRIALEQMAVADTVAERLTAATLLAQLASNPADIAQRKRELRELEWLLHVQKQVVRQDGLGDTMGRLARGEYHALRAAAARSGRWPPPEHFRP